MAPTHHVLLLGGHGKISQLLTPLLLQRSWTVTSVIRAQEQVAAIEKLGAGQPGKLNVLVASIDDVTSQDKAASILNQVKPDYIAWSAGAGGKGGPERTFKIDRDAAIHFIQAAAAIPSVTRFLLVSYIGSRRSAPSWVEPADWDKYNKSVNQAILANYYKAKLEADEVLYRTSKQSSSLIGICLRPGTLSDNPAGKVSLGKIDHMSGNISRESVAKVASALLAADDVKNSWVDLLEGDQEVERAVERVTKENIDTAEGEPVYGSD